MKRILGIVGSPRKLGNCEVLTKEICRQVPEEHELRLLRLQDFRIKDCTACYRCLYDGKCVLDDDLGTVLEALCWADAYIVAVPAYFLGVNAAFKALMDRGLSFYGVKERLWGKPSIAVAVAGIEGKEGSTLLSVQSFLKGILSDIKASVVFYAALPGEVFFDTDKLETVRHLGTALFGEKMSTGEPCCPLCGGDSFRFIGAGKVRCMLCGNDGTFQMAAGSPVFDIQRGGHALFLDRQEALRHEQWLRGMKDRFLAELPRIKAIREHYKGGAWVKPRERDAEA